MGPRWKGKGSKAKAAAEPMSEIISTLKSSLITSNSKGIISGCSVLLEATLEQSTALNRACFGRVIVTSEKDRQWYEFGLEEAFYLSYTLKCLEIVDHDSNVKTDAELWHYMCSKIKTFPEFFKAYSHLRVKNWVVRPGSQYGVDFVAYRHHPALVHSEYAVLVVSDKDGNSRERLRLWSDLHCTIRLCGGVAKTLLVLHVLGKGSETDSPTSLDEYEVIEQTISRWIPEQNREQNATTKTRDFPTTS
ncbi:hypothetical protein RND81_09G127400 [Saponaria officinalis]|uniref:tRNA-intron lyase n=1 Tax=Saponaria officinalis TaxID=3572 RepID=A0AAW1IKW8_SAPOF